MAKKKGAGGELQDFNTNNGRYLGDNAEDIKALAESLKQEINEPKYIEKKADNNDLTADTPKDFIDKLSKAKESVPEDRRWRVDIHDETEYANDKLYISKGGSCVAIEPNGNIISVCRTKGDNVRGADLLEYAINNGGDRLDAFSGLYNFYTDHGFEPVSWTPFNEEYAPDGWKPEYGKEPVIFYKYTGKKSDLTYDDFIRNNKPFADYKEAKDYRDKEIKK